MSHIIILIIIAVIVVPPEKLPEFARQVARFFNDIRRSTSGLWDDIKKDAAFKPEDLMKPYPPQNVVKPDVVKTEETTVEKKPHDS